MDDIDTTLGSLVGLKLFFARRVADMRIFGFGEIRQYKKAPVGEIALHIQCPWRIDGPDGIVTGRGDLWEHTSGNLMSDDWDPSLDDNVQDIRIGELLRGFDPETRYFMNTTELLVVEQVKSSRTVDLTIILSGGYALSLFPAGIKGEQWRILRPRDISSHIVFAEGSFED